MNPTLLGFALGWIGSMPLAGPVSVLVVKRGLAGRARCGIALAIGAALAETGWCSAALFGYGALLDRWSWMRPAAGAVGGTLMIGIGLRMLLGRALVRDDATGPEAPRRSWPREFILGFSIVLVNVSVLLSWLGILAALHALGLNARLDSAAPADHAYRLSFVAGVPLGIVAWFTLLLWLMAHTGSRIHGDWIRRAVRVLGGVLCAAGTWALVVVGRRLFG
jgi:threonine/homoserine/homoserine lactone efflux protein